MSNRTISDTTKSLMKAKEIIQDPKHWTKHFYYYQLEERFCMLGALGKANGWNTPEPYSIFMAAKRREQDKVFLKSWQHLERAVGGTIGFFNDNPGTSHKNVMEAFDKAISASMPNSSVLENYNG